MKILLVGDIVGSPGRAMFKKTVAKLRAENAVHVVVANAENAAAGSGITLALAKELLDAGADAITLGDHTWGQKEFEQQAACEKRVVRPANFAEGVPGQGSTVIHTNFGDLAIVALQGRVFMNPIDCPFLAMDRVLKTLPGGVPILVDFHAEATSEKIAMGYYLDGRVAALFGTHTHVQTSDARLLTKGTAYITDLGMTGPRESVIGREVEPVLKKFVTGVPSRFEVASAPSVLEGAILEIDNTTKRALSITALRVQEEALG